MEDFVYKHTTGKEQEQLEHAMQGRGAFRRFKDKLFDLDLERKWYTFRDEAYKKIAREWCENTKLISRNRSEDGNWIISSSAKESKEQGITVHGK